jgi:hypothetical protein
MSEMLIAHDVHQPGRRCWMRRSSLVNHKDAEELSETGKAHKKIEIMVAIIIQ